MQLDPVCRTNKLAVHRVAPHLPAAVVAAVRVVAVLDYSNPKHVAALERSVTHELCNSEQQCLLLTVVRPPPDGSTKHKIKRYPVQNIVQPLMHAPTSKADVPEYYSSTS